jgi:glycosyltransferase involved in cell wall biosynthesis
MVDLSRVSRYVHGNTSRVTPLVVALGRLVQQKGFDILLKAHARLIRSGLQYQLIIAGEGQRRNQLEELIEELGVRTTVALPGFVDDPVALLKQATVFAMPSRLEGCPMALLEAMTAGVPVIASDCPSGPSEILGGGRYGMLVSPEDEEGLASAIRRVLTDAPLRNALSAAGRSRAEAFTDQKVVPQWESLLEWLREGTKSHPSD